VLALPVILWKLNQKLRKLPIFRLHPNLPAMLLHDNIITDRQAQARSLSRRLRGKERIENFFTNVKRNAVVPPQGGIANADCDLFVWPEVFTCICRYRRLNLLRAKRTVGTATMNINDIVWLDEIVDKIESEHHVYQAEVEEYSATVLNIEKAKRANTKAKICFMLMAAPTAAVICLWCSFIN
jgi:hypothetical protein